MIPSTIKTLETDLKQYLLDKWGIKQQRKYSIFIDNDWHLLAKPRKEKEIKKHLTEVCGLDIQNLNTIVLGYFQNETIT